jgi:hypothetical protein
MTSPTRTVLSDEALGGEVLDGDLSGGQQEVGAVVGQDTVVLFGHPAVEGPQSGLEVRNGDVHLDGGDGRGEGGVGVAVNEDAVRGRLFQDFFQPVQHGTGLGSVLA